MKLDLHVHTKYSRDSLVEPEDIAKAASKRGLDGIAVTDHGTIKGGVEVRRFAKDGLEVVVGSEIKTDRGEVIGYNLNEEIKSGNFESISEEIRRQGGVVCIPHPFDFLRFSTLSPSKEILKHIDCIEVFNSRCIVQSFNARAQKFAREHKLCVTAGSDAHTLAEVGGGGVLADSLDLRKFTMENAEIFGRKTPLRNILRARFARMF